jgi:two-component system phosphate regulon response regulator PhoB
MTNTVSELDPVTRSAMSRVPEAGKQSSATGPGGTSGPAAPRTPAPSTPGASAANPAQKRKTVLVVDDEKDLVELVGYNLQRSGYHVITASSGTEALDLARTHKPDLLLLDLMLPGLEGTEVARRLKADPATSSIPIVMLTAKGEETDVVVGLTLGADDYVAKPFSMKILLARLNNVLRRTETAVSVPDNTIIRAGPLSIDTSKHEVTIGSELIKLTLTEFKLLVALATARGRVLTRDQLMDKAMGADVFVTDRAIDVHVTAIRKKLGSNSWLVHTVRGVGYRLQESPDEIEG